MIKQFATNCSSIHLHTFQHRIRVCVVEQWTLQKLTMIHYPSFLSYAKNDVTMIGKNSKLRYKHSNTEMSFYFLTKTWSLNINNEHVPNYVHILWWYDCYSLDWQFSCIWFWKKFVKSQTHSTLELESVGTPITEFASVGVSTLSSPSEVQVYYLHTYVRKEIMFSQIVHRVTFFLKT